MSESKKEMLTATFRELSTSEKAWAINFLVQLLANPDVSVVRRAKVSHNDDYSDAQWEDYFGNTACEALPDETASLKDVVQATAGKTIKPMRKWL